MTIPADAHARINLLGLTRPELEAFMVTLGEKPFRARQLMKWIYHEGVADFDAMTDLAKKFRARLAEVAEVRAPEVVLDQASGDGSHKWLIRVDSGNCIESVFIPETDRGTLCVSSQIGCALDCSFCSTAQQGFNRNLSVAEIVGQVWAANHALGWGSNDTRIITNVVMMGMGEPLANFANVVAAMQIMLDDFGFGLFVAIFRPDAAVDQVVLQSQHGIAERPGLHVVLRPVARGIVSGRMRRSDRGAGGHAKAGDRMRRRAACAAPAGIVSP